MSTFSIVILNYNTCDLTTKCIESFRRNNKGNDKLNFVIVDNCSTDKSGFELKNIYENDVEVSVIINNENLGFSKGNNIGLEYALNNFRSDFIVFSNSDVIINENNFFEKVNNIYLDSGFAILGPDVYNPLTKYHQSPLIRKPKLDQYFIKKRKINLSIKKIILYFQFVIPILKRVSNRIKKQRSVPIFINEVVTDCVIHGSFLIFSKQFLNEYPMGFYNEVFMYGEEEILYCMAIQRGLKIVYDPTIQVLHYEEQSTNKTFPDDKVKGLFKINNMMESTKILDKIIADQIFKEHITNG